MYIREALAQGSADLKFAGIKTPGLDASLLLAHVLKMSRTELLSASTEILSEEACEEYCSLIERRCFGECTAYLTGIKEFRGLEFKVNKSVLVPRPDTETLVEAALEEIGMRNRDIGSEELKINVLDLCTGSGAVAIALKHERPELEVYAADISKEALEIAKENANKLLGDKKIQIFHSDLFYAFCITHFSFSLIISNPPYIPSDEIEMLSAEVQNEPRMALDGGKTGLEIIERIINKAPFYLQHNGTLLLEADPRQMEEIKMLLEKNKFKDIDFFNDLSDNQRVISGRYEK
ncbi:MAG: peptide chain release factor N(5)-glutamine methyltransferase [Treponema sp.]|nr:peptide chain release factor N(5)-glutamine methyltransferase [Treponema sp.]